MNYSKIVQKTNYMPSKTTINWLFNDIWCYLFIACFDWKIDVFKQTVVRVYYILNNNSSAYINAHWPILFTCSLEEQQWGTTMFKAISALEKETKLRALNLT